MTQVRTLTVTLDIPIPTGEDVDVEPEKVAATLVLVFNNHLLANNLDEVIGDVESLDMLIDPDVKFAAWLGKPFDDGLVGEERMIEFRDHVREMRARDAT